MRHQGRASQPSYSCSMLPGRRLLWDCSHIASVPHLNTGIERVVRQLGQALLEVGAAHGFEVVPCVTDGTARIHRIDMPEVSDEPLERAGSPIVPSPEDVWVLADHAWDPQRLMGISPWWRQGMRIVLVQYDLVPLRLPAATTPLTAALFSQWMSSAVAFADAFVSISGATKDALIESLEVLAPWRSFGDGELPVMHLASTWHPERRQPHRAPRDPWRLLSVGTIEPRKRYEILLDVFEEHWGRGGRTELCVVGRKGWNSGSLQKRLAKLDGTEGRFTWLSDAGDEALERAYLEADAFVSLSSEEGFGLPVIEAAAAGLPLVVSDIPVYREITGGQAYMVEPNADKAREQLLALLEGLDAGDRDLAPPPESLASRTWRDTAEELLQAVASLPPPNQELRSRWDHRAALALTALWHPEPRPKVATEPDGGPGVGGAGMGGAGAGEAGAGEAGAGVSSARQRLAVLNSRLRTRAPLAVVRMMHLRNQAFRLVRQLDARTSVIEARIARLAKVYPTANALREVRSAEADRLLRYQLDAILIDVEDLMEELSGGPGSDPDTFPEDRARVVRMRERLRGRGHG